eukprot:Nk52_evm46s221 gene=Nk52_evmTU46s221
MISTGKEDDPGWAGKGVASTSRGSADDISDKYFRLREEYAALKTSHASQGEKMKRMATKLLRLTADLKKQGGTGGGHVGSSRSAGARDVDKDNMIEDMKDQVRELTRNNESLKNKLMVTRQQLEEQCRRKTPYSGIPSRTNSGVLRRKSSASSSSNFLSNRPSSTLPSKPSSKALVNQKSSTKLVAELEKNSSALESNLEQSKREYAELQQAYNGQAEKVKRAQEDVDELKEYIKRIEKEHDKQLSEVQANVSSRRGSIQEDINYIKLQREIRDKAQKLQFLQKKYETIEVTMTNVKKNHEAVLQELDGLHGQLKQEREKNVGLEHKLRTKGSSQDASLDIKQILNDLRSENELLKGENQKLIEAAFDDAREKEFRKIETKLKDRIAELELKLNGDFESKDALLQQLQGEKSGNLEMEKMHKDLQIAFFELKQVNEKLQDKLKFFTQEGDVTPEEIEEAWALIRAKKDKSSTTYLSFLQDDIPSDTKGVERELHEMRTAHAETVMELEKTRKLLSIQYGINKDYKSEIEDLKHKVELMRRDYEFRLDEYAHATDLKTNKIGKLESQLRDIAYGTREYKVEDIDSDDEEGTVELGRGQNLFEFKISVVLFSGAALELFFGTSKAEPSTFVSWDFFEFETQATPVIKGGKAEYNFTSQYIVDVDDFFLHYIQKDSMTLEIHQVVGGTDYKTLGSCNVVFRDLMDKTGRLSYTRKILCNDDPSLSLGTIEYKIYMKLPMTTSISLYKERIKAMGYISHNSVEKDLEEEEKRINADVGEPNKLSVSILQASGLEKVDSAVGSANPSSYCMYKFYDFVDHDTRIVANNSQPVFNDSKAFNVTMSQRLHGYLNTSHLEVFVFDDSGHGGVIGSAIVPLKPLASNKPIEGVYQVLNKRKECVGKLELSLSWKYPYLLQKDSSTEPYPNNITRESPKMHKASDNIIHKQSPVSSKTSSSAVPSSPRTLMDVPSIGIDPGSAEFPDVQGQVSNPRSANNEKQTSPYTQDKSQSDIPKSLSVSPRSPNLSTSDTNIAKGEIPAMDKKSLSVGRVEKGNSRSPSPSQERISRPNSNLSVAERGTRRSRSRSCSRSPSREQVEKEESSESPQIARKEEETSVLDDIDTDIEELISSGDEETHLEVKDFMDRSTLVEESKVTGVTAVEEVEMVSKQASRNMEDDAKGPCKIKISVNSMTTLPLMDAICEVDVERVFVCYNFLDVSPEQTETQSMEIQGPHIPMRFNFMKEFDLDDPSNSKSREMLSQTIKEKNRREGEIVFSAVSEPNEDDYDTECVDLGVASANLFDILEQNADISHTKIDLMHESDNGTKEKIGAVDISISALTALKALQN